MCCLWCVCHDSFYFFIIIINSVWVYWPARIPIQLENAQTRFCVRVSSASSITKAQRKRASEETTDSSTSKVFLDVQEKSEIWKEKNAFSKVENLFVADSVRCACVTESPALATKMKWKRLSTRRVNRFFPRLFRWPRKAWSLKEKYSCNRMEKRNTG